MSFLGLQNATYLNINVADVICQNLIADNGVSLGGDVNIAGELSVGTSPNSYIFPFNSRPTQGQVLAAADGNGDLGWVTIGSGGGGIVGINNTDNNLTTSEANNIVTINLAQTIDVPTVISDQIQVGTEYTLPKTFGPTGYVLSSNGLAGLCQWQASSGQSLTGGNNINVSGNTINLNNTINQVQINQLTAGTNGPSGSAYIFPAYVTTEEAGYVLGNIGAGNLGFIPMSGGAGVYSVIAGTNVNITGTNQNPVVNLDTAIDVANLTVGTTNGSGQYAYSFPEYVVPEQNTYVLAYNSGDQALEFVPQQSIENITTNLNYFNDALTFANAVNSGSSFGYNAIVAPIIIPSGITYDLIIKTYTNSKFYCPNNYCTIQSNVIVQSSSSSVNFEGLIFAGTNIFSMGGNCYFTNCQFNSGTSTFNGEAQSIFVNCTFNTGTIFETLPPSGPGGHCILFFQDCDCFALTMNADTNGCLYFSNCSGLQVNTLTGSTIYASSTDTETDTTYSTSMKTDQIVIGEYEMPSTIGNIGYVLTCNTDSTVAWEPISGGATGTISNIIAGNSNLLVQNGSGPNTTITVSSNLSGISSANIASVTTSTLNMGSAYKLTNVNAGPTGSVMTCDGPGQNIYWSIPSGGIGSTGPTGNNGSIGSTGPTGSGSITTIASGNSNLLINNPTGPNTTITLSSNLSGLSTANISTVTTSTLNMGSAYKLINVAPTQVGSVLTCDSSGGDIYWSIPTGGTGTSTPNVTTNITYINDVSSCVSILNSSGSTNFNAIIAPITIPSGQENNIILSNYLNSTIICPTNVLYIQSQFNAVSNCSNMTFENIYFSGLVSLNLTGTCIFNRCTFNTNVTFQGNANIIINECSFAIGSSITTLGIGSGDILFFQTTNLFNISSFTTFETGRCYFSGCYGVPDSIASQNIMNSSSTFGNFLISQSSGLQIGNYQMPQSIGSTSYVLTSDGTNAIWELSQGSTGTIVGVTGGTNINITGTPIRPAINLNNNITVDTLTIGDYAFPQTIGTNDWLLGSNGNNAVWINPSTISGLTGPTGIQGPTGQAGQNGSIGVTGPTGSSINTLFSNTLYVNDNVNDIQSAINIATTGNAIYMSAGSYGGSVVSMTNKSNLNIICPYGQGTCTELASGRGININNTNNSIQISNLQIGGSSSLSGNGCKYERCNFTGVSVITFGSLTTGFIIAENCDFTSTCVVTVPATFAGVIYFINCNFGGATLNFQQSQAVQVIITNCVGLTTFNPTKATMLAYSALTNGQSQANATNVNTTNLTVNNLLYPTPTIASTVLGYNGSSLNWVSQSGGGITNITAGNSNLIVSNPAGPNTTLTVSSNLSGLSSANIATITSTNATVSASPTGSTDVVNLGYFNSNTLQQNVEYCNIVTGSSTINSVLNGLTTSSYIYYSAGTDSSTITTNGLNHNFEVQGCGSGITFLSGGLSINFNGVNSQYIFNDICFNGVVTISSTVACSGFITFNNCIFNNNTTFTLNGQTIRVASCYFGPSHTLNEVLVGGGSITYENTTFNPTFIYSGIPSSVFNNCYGVPLPFNTNNQNQFNAYNNARNGSVVNSQLVNCGNLTASNISLLNYSMPSVNGSTGQVLASALTMGGPLQWVNQTGGGGSTTIEALNTSVIVSPTGTNAYIIGANVVYYNIQNINEETELVPWFATTEVDGGNTELAPINLSNSYSLNQWTNSYINSSAGECIWGGTLMVNQCGNLTINNMTFNNSVTISNITGNIYFNDCIFVNIGLEEAKIIFNVNSSTSCEVVFDNCVFRNNYEINSMYSLPNNNNTLSFFNCDLGTGIFNQTNGNARFNSCYNTPNDLSVTGNMIINSSMVSNNNIVTTTNVNTQQLIINSGNTGGYSFPIQNGPIGSVLTSNSNTANIPLIWKPAVTLYTTYYDIAATLSVENIPNSTNITLANELTDTAGNINVTRATNFSMTSFGMTPISGGLEIFNCINFQLTNLQLNNCTLYLDWELDTTVFGGLSVISNCQFNNVDISILSGLVGTQVSFQNCYFNQCTFAYFANSVQTNFSGCDFNPENSTTLCTFSYSSGSLVPTAGNCFNIPPTSSFNYNSGVLSASYFTNLCFGTQGVSTNTMIPIKIYVQKVTDNVAITISFMGISPVASNFFPTETIHTSMFVENPISTVFTQKNSTYNPYISFAMTSGCVFQTNNPPNPDGLVVRREQYAWTMRYDGTIFCTPITTANYFQSGFGYNPAGTPIQLIDGMAGVDFSMCSVAGSYTLSNDV